MIITGVDRANEKWTDNDDKGATDKSIRVYIGYALFIICLISRYRGILEGKHMEKKKYTEIIIGFFCSLILWILPTILSGEILGGDILTLNYSHLGFGKIYFVLFFIYNITIAVYTKKKGKRTLFISSLIITMLPIIGYMISFLSFFTGNNNNVVSTILYVLGSPMSTAIYIYAESAMMTIITGIIIFISPIVSILVYKFFPNTQNAQPYNKNT